MRALRSREIYLERMAKPLQEKLKIVKFIPVNAKSIVDVGCANGTITIEFAKLFPDIQFLGIDLDEKFIEEAKKKSTGVSNVKFERVYLRELLARPERFDAVIFLSVLHEFFSYGEGISSVVKAIADGHELLNKEGTIIIRDMILPEYTKKANLNIEQIVKKIKQKKFYLPYLKDFERYFGKLNSIYKTNHFLLKYWYSENWQREVKEHYVPVTFENYETIFALLGMKVQFKEVYLIDYLKNKWMDDFGLTEDEALEFKSTGMIISHKN